MMYFPCVILTKAFKCPPGVSGIILCLQKKTRCQEGLWLSPPHPQLKGAN